MKRNAAPKDDVFEQDGDFVKEYDINDLRVRYTLTKAPVMKKVNLNHITLIQPSFSFPSLCLLLVVGLYTAVKPVHLFYSLHTQFT